MLGKARQFIPVHKHAFDRGSDLPATLNCRKQNALPRAFRDKGRQHSLLHRLRIRQAQDIFQQPGGRARPGFAGQHLTACGKIPAARRIRRLPPARQPLPPVVVAQAYQRDAVRHIPSQGRLFGGQQQGAAPLIENFNQPVRSHGQTDIGRKKHALS